MPEPTVDVPNNSCGGATVGACALALVLAFPVLVAAQAWPRTPIALWGDRIAVGGDVTATYGSDDRGYFNYTDYESSALRRLRGSLLLSVSTGPHVAWLAELRAASDDGLGLYAAFVRVTPWPKRSVALQAGRVPPVFGSFARRGYAHENPLVGEPLAYQ